MTSRPDTSRRGGRFCGPPSLRTEGQMLLCFLKIGTPVAQVSFYTTGNIWFCFSHFTLNCFSLLADTLSTSRKKSPPSWTSRIFTLTQRGSDGTPPGIFCSSWKLWLPRSFQECQPVRRKNKHGPEPVSTPPADKCHPGQQERRQETYM